MPEEAGTSGQQSQGSNSSGSSSSSKSQQTASSSGPGGSSSSSSSQHYEAFGLKINKDDLITIGLAIIISYGIRWFIAGGAS